MKKKKERVVQVKCTRCKWDDFAWESDAKNHVCMDCVACDMNEKTLDSAQEAAHTAKP